MKLLNVIPGPWSPGSITADSAEQARPISQRLYY
jgi:hypothetical protein